MKKLVLSMLSMWLTTMVLVAQDTTGAGAIPNPQDHRAASQSSTALGSRLRGCLSGSAGNFTITDPNGIQYRLIGDDMALSPKVGHEIEVSGTPNYSKETSNRSDEDMAQTGDSFQVSDVKDVSIRCNQSRSQHSPDEAAPPDNETNTKGTPSTESKPPQLMAMLRQAAAPKGNNSESSNHAQSSSMSSTTTSTSQASRSVDSAPQPPAPPSQVPAPDSSRIQPTPQGGSRPANDIGTTSADAERNSEAARQSELNTNSRTGGLSGRGIDNQGVNKPAPTISSPTASGGQNEQNRELPDHNADTTKGKGSAKNPASGGPPQ